MELGGLEPPTSWVLAAPDRVTWTGRRDHILLLLAVQSGLRASELTTLDCGDVHLGTGAHVSCHGSVSPGRRDHPSTVGDGEAPRWACSHTQRATSATMTKNAANPGSPVR